MVHHYVPTIHPFHRHFVNFPTPRHCHACSKSGHIAAFGCSHPPCHPWPGVTPFQHWAQRPFFWEAGTLIGGPPPLSSYLQQHFTCMCMHISISSVGGKMVQCISHLWRLVSAVRIGCNHDRSRILHREDFGGESRSSVL